MSKARPFLCQWCGEWQRIVCIEPDCGLWLCNDCSEELQVAVMVFDKARGR